MVEDMVLPQAKKATRTFSVFNQTRESFISFNVTPADSELLRLKGLLGKVKLKADEGIWLYPSQGIHTIGMLFPIDVIYLDGGNRVILAIESMGTFRIGPIRGKCNSVLELPTRSIYSSGTEVGDQLVICAPEEIAGMLQVGTTSASRGGLGCGDRLYR